MAFINFQLFKVELRLDIDDPKLGESELKIRNVLDTDILASLQKALLIR